MPLLAPERDVIALDMPGFGCSPALPDGGRPHPARAGPSGGRLHGRAGDRDARTWPATRWAAGWPSSWRGSGRARSVTGLCSAGFWRGRWGPSPTPPARWARAAAAGRRCWPAASAGAGGCSPGSPSTPSACRRDAAARLVRAYITAPGFEGANAAMRSAVFSGIEDIGVPVTLAWADHDRLVAGPRRRARRRRRVLRGCGHMPTWDDPEQVARVLLEASTAASAAA